MKTKLNLGFAPSQNFNKVNIELLDYEIEYESDIGFQKEVRRLYKLLRREAQHQFEEWEKEVEFNKQLKAQKRG